MFRVLTLVGSFGKPSINNQLCEFVMEMGSATFEFVRYDISKLPFHCLNLEEDLPAPVAEFKKLASGCDAVLIVTPEHNRSMPGVLKNAIDWGSRPPGNNSWRGKPAGIMGASPGGIATFGAQQHLRNTLACVGVAVMPQPDYYCCYPNAFDESGQARPQTREFTAKWLQKFEQWIVQMKK